MTMKRLYCIAGLFLLSSFCRSADTVIFDAADKGVRISLPTDWVRAPHHRALFWASDIRPDSNNSGEVYVKTANSMGLPDAGVEDFLIENRKMELLNRAKLKELKRGVFRKGSVEGLFVNYSYSNQGKLCIQSEYCFPLEKECVLLSFCCDLAQFEKYEPIFRKAVESFALQPIWQPPKTYEEARRQIPTRLIRKWDPPRPDLKETFPEGAKQIEYTSGKLKLKAWLLRPETEGPVPTVVYAHSGYALNPREVAAIKIFQYRGYAVLAPTWRGEQGNPGSVEFFRGEVDDLIAAGKYAAKQPWADPKRLYVIGLAEGATLTMLSSFLPNPFCEAITVQGSTRQLDYFSRVLLRIQPTFDFRNYRELAVRSPYCFPSSLDTPLVMIEARHSTRFLTDNLVFSSAARATGRPCRFVCIDGSDDSFFMDGLTEASFQLPATATNKAQVPFVQRLRELEALMRRRPAKEILPRARALARELPDAETSLISKANCALGLGMMLGNLRAYEEAESCFAYAAPILLKQADPRSKKGASFAYRQMGVMQHHLRKLTAAEASLRESLRLAQQFQDPLLSGVVHVCLGQLQMDRAELGEAERSFTKAIELMKQMEGTALAMQVRPKRLLAKLHSDAGNHREAILLLSEIIQLQINLHGRHHPGTWNVLETLGLAYRRNGQIALSLKTYDEVIESMQATPRKDPFALARVYHLKGAALIHNGRYEEAHALQKQALGIAERLRGKGSPALAGHLNNLGWINLLRGNLDRAKPQLVQSAELIREARGPQSENYGNSLSSLCCIAILEKDFEEAIRTATASNLIYEQAIQSLRTFGTDKQKLVFLRKIRGKTDQAVGLHRRYTPENLVAAELALRTILQRKARAQDMVVHSLAALRRKAGPEDLDALESLTRLRAMIASQELHGGHAYDIFGLRRQALAIEQDLQRRLTPNRRPEKITVTAVQKRLHQDTALVEFFFYRPWKPEVPRKDRETIPMLGVAYVLTSKGEPFSYDLGDEPALAAMVKAHRDALQKGGDAHEKPGAALYRRLLQPALKKHPKILRWVVAPDGALNLLPFGALVDSAGEYLASKVELAHVTCGRDLLWLPEVPGEVKEISVFAAPDYDRADTDGGEKRILRFPPLPGTKREAAGLSKLFPSARIRIGKEATVEAFKAEEDPSILHVATHGFFKGAQGGAGGESRGLKKTGGGTPSKRPARANEIYIGNPLVHSGLALSGANHASATKEDGLLTSLEIAGMDLSSTELVVLSACNTGVGWQENGTGVFGLRRAFALAGAKTQVLSLWPVDDDATCELMRLFYIQLRKGKGRAEALALAQRQMLKGKFAEPKFWSAFITAGDWRPLTFPRK